MNQPITRALRDITDDLRKVQALAEDGEIPAEALADTLEGIEGTFEKKAEQVGHVLIDNDATKKVLKDEIDRLKARLKVVENGDARLRHYLVTNMEASGIKTVKGEFVTLTAAVGRESVIIENEDAIPDDLVNTKVVVTPDKAAIKNRIQAGDEVPGAKMQRSPTTLRVK